MAKAVAVVAPPWTPRWWPQSRRRWPAGTTWVATATRARVRRCARSLRRGTRVPRPDEQWQSRRRPRPGPRPRGESGASGPRRAAARAPARTAARAAERKLAGAARSAAAAADQAIRGVVVLADRAVPRTAPRRVSRLTRGNTRPARASVRAFLFPREFRRCSPGAQQAARRQFAQVEHAFEVLDAAVIRVGHLVDAGLRARTPGTAPSCARGARRAAGVRAPRDWRGPWRARSRSRLKSSARTCRARSRPRS